MFTLQKTKHLAGLGERLVETKKKLITPIKEFEDVVNNEMLNKTTKNSLAAIDKVLKILK